MATTREAALNERVKHWRKARGLKQAELEGKAGLPRGAVYRIENDQKDVTATELQALAQALDIDTITLLAEPQTDRLQGALLGLLVDCSAPQRYAMATFLETLAHELKATCQN